MTSCQIGAGWYSVPFNRNKCSSLIDTAWLKKKEVILEYRLASLSYNTSTPNNQLRGEHHFRWQLGWKTWMLKWSYDLLGTFTFLWSIIPFLLCNFNFFSYALHAFWYYDEWKSHELWNDRCWQTMYPLKTSALPVSVSSPEENKWRKKSYISHSLDCRVYRWKHGHFAHLDRTQWPGFEVLVLSPRSSFFQVPTVLWHYGCITLQFAIPSLL